MLYELMTDFEKTPAGEEFIPGMIVAAYTGPCFICRRKCRTIDIDYEAYLCSTECGQKAAVDAAIDKKQGSV